MERYTERSGLPKGARDVLFLLARRMDQGSTVIPLQHSPSLSTIARHSGWSKRHVQRFLNLLEQAGLLYRNRPSPYEARARHARTAYTVNVQQLQELARDTQSQAARDKVSLPLGTPGPGARDTGTPAQGTGSRAARDTVAHSQTLSDQPGQPDPEIALIVSLLKVRTGEAVSGEWADGVRQQLLGRPGADGQAPAAYIRRALSTDPNPQRWLPPRESQIPKEEAS